MREVYDPISDDITDAIPIINGTDRVKRDQKIKELSDYRAKGGWPGIPSEVWIEILRGNITPYIALVRSFRAACNTLHGDKP